MKLAILLTATVKVQVNTGAFTTEQRAEMYASTLQYYVTKIGGEKKRYPIIFCENSDYDLTELKKEFEKNLDIEWIQIRPDSGVPFMPEKGKGYNEYLMIKEAVSRSEKLRDCTHFMKITGRYAMLNIISMIKEVERRAEDKFFMGDIKDTKVYDMIGRKNTDSGHWGDSRYWVANVEYYKEKLLDCYKEIDDSQWGTWAEDYLLNMGRKYRTDNRFIFRFRTQVFFNGIVSGKWTQEDLKLGKLRQDSLKKKLMSCIRQIMRWIFPNFWF